MKKTRVDLDLVQALFWEACTTGSLEKVRSLVVSEGADPAWIVSQCLPLVLPSVTWWSVYEVPIDENENVPLLMHICARPAKDMEAAAVLKFLLPLGAMEISREEVIMCALVVSARGSFDLWQSFCRFFRRVLRLNSAEWTQLLECAVLRSDFEGFRIAKRFIELGERKILSFESKHVFQKAFGGALSASFAKGWAVSACLLLESNYFIGSSKTRLRLLHLACCNRNDGSNLIHLLREKHMIRLDDDDDGRKKAFALACKFGNGEIVKTLLSVCPKAYFSCYGLFGNRVDPLGVLRAIYHRKKISERCGMRFLRRLDADANCPEVVWAILRVQRFQNFRFPASVCDKIHRLKPSEQRWALWKIARAEGLIRVEKFSSGGEESDPELHIAVAAGDRNVVKLLLQEGVNPFVKGSKGKLAVDIAKTPEITGMLKKYMRWDPAKVWRGKVAAWYGPIVYKRLYTFVLCMRRCCSKFWVPKEILNMIIQFILANETY